MKTLIADLLEYNQQANQMIIRSFVEDGFRVEEGVRLFSHLINAHHTWLARMRERTPMFDIWEIHVVNSFLQVDQKNHETSHQLLDTLPDLEASISYSNSQGRNYQNSYRDIFMHIINHSTYHRGQLARMIREEGFVPPNTDYIFYRREQL